ncbi:MAG: hypothetical protein L0Z71_17520 [Anaerolineae bacterium]|nr:hypothetical protein [Anaerolineae bacterium]
MKNHLGRVGRPCPVTETESAGNEVQARFSAIKIPIELKEMGGISLHLHLIGMGSKSYCESYF